MMLPSIFGENLLDDWFDELVGGFMGLQQYKPHEHRH